MAEFREIERGLGLEGRFHIETVIAEGGMGTVYRATQVSLDRPVALKVLKRSAGWRGQVEARFLAEAHLAARISHPNVVRVLEPGSGPFGLFIAYELIEGEALRTAMKRGLPLPQALHCVLQAAAALGAVHEAGAVHRDVKPENLLLDPQGVLKLTDLGIAKDLSKGIRTHSGMLFGTPAYMSPEQCRSQAVTPSSDIYSLGVVLFELLTGGLPFDYPTPLQLLEAHLHELPPRPSTRNKLLPRGWDPVILKALEKPLSRRYGSAAEMAQALEPLLLKARTLGQARRARQAEPIELQPTLAVARKGEARAKAEPEDDPTGDPPAGAGGGKAGAAASKDDGAAREAGERAEGAVAPAVAATTVSGPFRPGAARLTAAAAGALLLLGGLWLAIAPAGTPDADPSNRAARTRGPASAATGPADGRRAGDPLLDGVLASLRADRALVQRLRPHPARPATRPGVAAFQGRFFLANVQTIRRPMLSLRLIVERRKTSGAGPRPLPGTDGSTVRASPTSEAILPGALLETASGSPVMELPLFATQEGPSWRVELPPGRLRDGTNRIRVELPVPPAGLAPELRLSFERAPEFPSLAQSDPSKVCPSCYPAWSAIQPVWEAYDQGRLFNARREALRLLERWPQCGDVLLASAYTEYRIALERRTVGDVELSLGVAMLGDEPEQVAPDWKLRDNAADKMDEAIRLYPGWQEPWYRYARTSHALGDTELAVRSARFAVSLAPADYRLWLELADAELTRAQKSRERREKSWLEEAQLGLQHVERSLQLQGADDQGNLKGWWVKGTLLAGLGRTAEARPLFEKILRVKPECGRRGSSWRRSRDRGRGWGLGAGGWGLGVGTSRGRARFGGCRR